MKDIIDPAESFFLAMVTLPATFPYLIYVYVDINLKYNASHLVIAHG